MMNPEIAPNDVAANVVPNDSPAAKPNEGAKNVFTIDAKTTEKIFQNIFISKKFVFLPSQKRHFSSVGRATHS